MRHEAFLLDGGLAVLDAGRDMHLVAGVPRRTGHRQPVRQEVPVLGDDIEQGGGHGPRLYQRGRACETAAGRCDPGTPIFGTWGWRCGAKRAMVSANQESSLGDYRMKHLPLVLVLSGLAGLAAAPAYAFDIEGQNASLEDGASHFTSPVEDFITSNGGARSLAMPLTGKSDASDTHIRITATRSRSPARESTLPPGPIPRIIIRNAGTEPLPSGSSLTA